MIMQRLFDVLFSSIAIFLLLPLLLPVILILRFTGEREIFYLQKRVGKGGKTFNVIKFATMLKNSPNLGSGTITLQDDPRVLPFGKFLRKSKINELPQLFNILIGEMSVVGPRPLTYETFSAYTENVQKVVTRVTPGLSGLGSIIFRDEESLLSNSKSSIDFYNLFIAPYKGELERWYVNNQSIKVYFILILLTVQVVIFPKSRLVWSLLPDLPEPPAELKMLGRNH